MTLVQQLTLHPIIRFCGGAEHQDGNFGGVGLVTKYVGQFAESGL